MNEEQFKQLIAVLKSIDNNIETLWRDISDIPSSIDSLVIEPVDVEIMGIATELKNTNKLLKELIDLKRYSG